MAREVLGTSTRGGRSLGTDNNQPTPPTDEQNGSRQSVTWFRSVCVLAAIGLSTLGGVTAGILFTQALGHIGLVFFALITLLEAWLIRRFQPMIRPAGSILASILGMLAAIVPTICNCHPDWEYNWFYSKLCRSGLVGACYPFVMKKDTRHPSASDLYAYRRGCELGIVYACDSQLRRRSEDREQTCQALLRVCEGKVQAYPDAKERLLACRISDIACWCRPERDSLESVNPTFRCADVSAVGHWDLVFENDLLPAECVTIRGELARAPGGRGYSLVSKILERSTKEFRGVQEYSLVVFPEQRAPNVNIDFEKSIGKQIVVRALRKTEAKLEIIPMQVCQIDGPR